MSKSAMFKLIGFPTAIYAALGVFIFVATRNLFVTVTYFSVFCGVSLLLWGEVNKLIEDKVLNTLYTSRGDILKICLLRTNSVYEAQQYFIDKGGNTFIIKLAKIEFNNDNAKWSCPTDTKYYIVSAEEWVRKFGLTTETKCIRVGTGGVISEFKM